jgi:4'-phosphopantetheinyl transferase
LSPDERRRAERFEDPVQTARYAIARAALRQLLGRYAEREPSRVRFAYGRAGKPRLLNGSVHFNLSRSGDVAIVALASGKGPLSGPATSRAGSSMRRRSRS